MTSSSSSSPEVSAATGADSESRARFSYKHATHDEVLEDLSSRFILNLPDEELASLERICFQVEQAHWFYEDFIREENPKLPSLPLKKFSAMLFHACPLLHHWSHDHEQAFNTFMQYKTRVPVCGAIMLNDTWEKCVLVKGWKSSSGWGFPKGKINEDEPPANCAVREVLEETGYNLAGQIDPKNVIEMSIKEQKISLFIVPGVPEDYEFKTKTRKEISKIEWFRLMDLPTWRRNKTAAGKFYLISPFIGALKAFINECRPRGGPRKTTRPKKTLPTQTPLASKGNPKHHDTTHESSSQSSSAENGEPHTPSPHYSEPLANPVSHVVDDEIIKADTTVTGMDPHFARLLSSLTMSASSPSHDVDGKKGVVVTPSMKANSPDHKKQTAPTPAPKSSRASPSALPRVDWSASVLSVTSPQVSTLTPSSKLLSPSLQPVISPSWSDQTRDDGSPHLTNDIEINCVDSLTRLDASSSTSGSTVEARSVIPHRTTDLSPHLPPPGEHPTSARILKQLALLEAVADESAKMSPFLARTAPSSNPTIANYNARISSPPGSLPPPPMISYNSNNHRVIYTSGTTVQPSTAHTASHMLNGIPLAQDPFQVRSKTSHAYHRDPLGGPSGRLSMNQSQLLALMSEPRATSQTPHMYSQPPSFQGMHLPPFHTSMPGAIRPPAQNFVHPLPPSPFPLRMNPTPYGGSSISSGIYAPPRNSYPASGSLLSILNSNRGSSGIPFNPATSPQVSHNGRTPQF